MASKLIITDQAFNPIGGTVTYYDLNGGYVGRESVPAAGKVLSSSLVMGSATATISAAGYYDYDTGTDPLLEGDVNVTMFKKPTYVVPLAIGLVVGYLVSQSIK